MGVTGKIEVEVDIKASKDVFHELFGSKPHHVSKMVPDHIHGCDVHEGDFGQIGSIIEWDYTADGKKEVLKVAVEVVDEEKKFIRYRAIEGHVLKDYKKMEITVQVIQKGDFDAVIWANEFEKLSDLGPYPTALVDLAISVTRGIEAHHANV